MKATFEFDPNNKAHMLEARAELVIRGWAGCAEEVQDPDVYSALAVAHKVRLGMKITPEEHVQLLEVVLATSLIAEAQAQLISDDWK